MDEKVIKALPILVPVCLLGASRVATQTQKKSLCNCSWQPPPPPNKPDCTAVRRSWSLVESVIAAKIMMWLEITRMESFFTGVMAY